MKKDFWRRVLSGLTTISLLVNSLLPYSIASVVYAQESPTPKVHESIESSLSEIPSVSPTPTPDLAPTPPADPISTPTPDVTPMPSPEITSTATPEATPTNLSPPTPTPTLEPSPTPDSIPDLNAKPEDVKSLTERLKADFPKDLQTQRLNYVPGEVIVKFKREKLNVNSIFGRAQAYVFEKKFSLNKTDEIKGSNIQVFRSKKSTEDLVKKLKSDPTVEYAEPNYLRFPTTIGTNDTYKDLLWGLDNTGQPVNGTVGTDNADIDAPEAWGVSEGSVNIIVAVIDSGVAYNHPDLAINMWDGSSCKDENGTPLGGCNHGYDFENNDKTPLPDSSSHGTHIAGIIAAAKNNSKGVIGVSPQAKIMALKYNRTIANEIKAIDFAIQNGAKIINASFTGTGFSTPEYEAINRFRTAGGIIVAAAGNESVNNESVHSYPSDYDLDNIISVAATDQNDSLASFSNYGETSVDVGAPGVNIYSTFADSDLLNETFEGVPITNIPAEWTKGGINNYWGVLDETAWLGSEWGKVLYGDRFYPYDDGADTMVTSPTYNLGSIGASIDFYTICDTEYITNGWADYMQLEYSSDGINFTPAIDPYTGDEFRWDEPTLDILSGENPLDHTGSSFFHYENISIPSQYLTSNFKFRFRWMANLTDNAYYGCLIDDVKITKFNDGSEEQYNYKDGTSMAAPHVAGLAALIWGYKPNLTLAQVKDRILQTGDTLPVAADAAKILSGKRINAFNALNGLNHPPTTSASLTTTDEDNPVTITLSGSDVDGDSLTYSSVSSPTHGTLGIISGNQVIYTPNLNYFGGDTFTFKANDGSADSNISTVSITINSINDTPIANADSATTNEDTTVSITLSGTDVDGNSLTYSIVSGVSHGTLGEISSDHISYTPSTNYNGPDSFTFKVNDGTVDSDPATVSITITPVNDAPVLNTIGNKTIDELSTLNFSATATDPDLPPQTLTYSLTSALAGATINSTTGAFNFTPTEAQGPNIYTVTVNVSDGVSTDSEEITITVNEVNVAPVVQDSSTSTNEDTAKTITLNATDSDLPAQPLIYSKVSDPSHGSVSITGNQATYAPSANYNGSDSFTFKVNDGISDSNIATVTINVSSVNDIPVAFNDSVSTDEDMIKVIILGATDADIPADTLTYSMVSNSSHGTVTLIGNEATYTPDTNYNGPDSFAFKVNDGTVDSNIATVSITVNPVPDAPIANSQSVTTNEDTDIEITLSGSDADGDTLTYSIISSPSNGTLGELSGNQVVYTPNANYVGDDSFMFGVDDTNLLSSTNFSLFGNATFIQNSDFFKTLGFDLFGLASVPADTATISITVTPINDAPVAGDDIGSVDEDTTLTIAKSDLLTNDSDVDGDTLNIISVGSAINGSVSIVGDDIDFVPEDNFNGTASFEYIVSDGTLTDTGTVTITVNPINDIPVADSQAVTVEEDSSETITLTGSDIDGDPLIFSIVSDPLHGSLGEIFGDQVAYSPNSDYAGSDSFEFNVNDGLVDSSPALVTITVTPFNDPPVLNPIGDFSINELEELVFTANANDPEGATLIYSLNGNPEGASINSSTGEFSWIPSESQGPGVYTFSVSVSDGAKTDSEEIVVTVNEVNQAPTAESVFVSTNEDIDKIISLSATDTDLPVNILTYSILSGPSHGNVSLSGNEATYTPDSDYNGADLFTYKVNDGALDSDTATVTLTIFPVNDAPLAENDITSTDEDVVLTIAMSTLLANDSDVDGDSLNIISVSNQVNGIVNILGSDVIFTPAANFYGTANFDYTITDGTLTDTATVIIDVNPVNDAPFADSQSITIDEDTPAAVVLTGNDIEGSPLTYSLLDNPSNGTLGALSDNAITYTPNSDFVGSDSFTFKVNDGEFDSNTAIVSITMTAVNDPPVLVSIGNQAINELANLTFTVSATDPDSSLTYSLINAPTGATINPTSGIFNFTPTEAQGPGEYTLTVSVTDGAATDSEEITITVNEVNTAPAALDDSVSTNEDTAKIITLSATDSDVPANTLTYSIVSGVSHGVLGTISGNQLTYTPSTDYNGIDSFTFKVNDNTNDSNTATVTINISPANDAPVANPDTASVDEDTSVTIAKSSLLANDTDVDGDSLTLISISNPVNGTVLIVADDVVFTPDVNYYGPASFDYTISDGSLTSVGTVSITVNFINDSPVAIDGAATTSQEVLVLIDLSASDVDGDSLTYSIDTDVSNGTLSVISGNQVTYTPNTDYVGVDSFTFKANDGIADSNIATISITVNPPPVISNEANNTPAETSITITWSTDHPSTSRVIYDTVSHLVLDAAPNYGYANSTIETDISPKVTLHSVTINGLVAGTTYYYRVVSHGSPEVVGDENTFTTESKKSGGEVAAASTTSSSSSVCSDQKPGSAPTLISIISSGLNEVTLIWTKAKDPVTYYLIAFGTKSGEMLYGNPFVGGKDTTSYTVKGLSSGTRYYFRVRAGNNCMPGDFSNELSTVAYGEMLSEIPEGFSPGVLGEEATTTEEVLGKETASPTPEISPVPQGGRSRRNIIFAGIGIILLAAGYYFFIRRKRE